MFKLLKDAFKVKDIRSRIFFTVLILFVFRLGTHITVPGVDASRLREHVELGQRWRDAAILDFLNGCVTIYYCVNRYSVVADGYRAKIC